MKPINALGFANQKLYEIQLEFYRDGDELWLDIPAVAMHIQLSQKEARRFYEHVRKAVFWTVRR